MANVRKCVFLSLLNRQENDRYANLEADSAIEKYALTDRDRAFFTALFYGAIEKQITLDYQIKKLSSTPIEKLQTKVLILLRMGLYQLLYMNSVPDHAAVSETVALAKETVNSGACGYINGVLRTASNKLKYGDRVSLITPDKAKDICGYLSITYSYPRFLCKLWIKAYGEITAEKIMQAQNRSTPATIRVNTLKITRNDYFDKLIKYGISAEKSQCTDDGIHLLTSSPITTLPGFCDGLFFVQDDSSRLCAEALGTVSGEKILDACACPGGKSFASAIRMKNCGSILSCDLHENKLSLIESGAKRLGIDIIKAKQADSSVYDARLDNAFDRVLCDVPCSGFGTISKKPDLRLKGADSVGDLPNIQLSIVNNCAKYVKNSGILVYSTCTLNPEENELNVRRFISEHSEFSLLEEKTFFPQNGMHDGFYYAKMIKMSK